MGAIKPQNIKGYWNAHTENGITDNENTITDYWYIKIYIYRSVYIYIHTWALYK